MEDNDALGLLQAVYRNSDIPLSVRMRAAGMALPFERPKLAVVVTNREGDLADRLMAALQASQQVMNSRPMQVIEHEAKPVDAVPEPAPDHGKAFASDLKSRFRRL
jgi:hypothetical protein